MGGGLARAQEPVGVPARSPRDWAPSGQSRTDVPPVTAPVVLPAGDAPGMISGIVGAVVVALGGAVSSFIAYQKKKWCFKGNGEAPGT